MKVQALLFGPNLYVMRIFYLLSIVAFMGMPTLVSAELLEVTGSVALPYGANQDVTLVMESVTTITEVVTTNDEGQFSWSMELGEEETQGTVTVSTCDLNSASLGFNPGNVILEFELGDCEPDEEVMGCTDPDALNYNAEATTDDGSCEYDEVDICEVGFEIVAEGTSATLILDDLELSEDASFYWTFGDGSESYDAAPEHQYDEFGTYEVCVTVVDQASDCVATVCQEFTLMGLVGADNGLKSAAEAFTLQVYFASVVSEVTIEGVVLNNASMLIPVTILVESTTTTTLEIETDESGYFSTTVDLGEDATQGSVTASILDCEGTEQSVSGGFALGSGVELELDYCAPEEVAGCTDPEAINYNAEATIDDGSCIYLPDSTCDATFTWELDSTAGVGFIFIDEFDGTEDLAYYWEFGDGNTSEEALPTHTYAEDGVYTVCVTIVDQAAECYSNFCADLTIVGAGANGFTLYVEFLMPNAIEEQAATGPEMTLFPNPTTADRIYVSVNNSANHQLEVRLFDAAMRLISTDLVYVTGSGNDRVQLAPGTMQPGLYHVILKDAVTGATMSSQLVIR